MADSLRTPQELEELQAQYVGTGYPDTASWEWRTNVYRDTYASIIGHAPLLNYIALAENEPVHKLRHRLIKKMLQPCGPPPPAKEEDLNPVQEMEPNDNNNKKENKNKQDT